MTTQHTPGPWFEDEAVSSQFMAQCLLDNPTWVAIEDTADDGGHVAYCAPGNAPIIAAAPDMFAALEALEYCLENPHSDAEWNKARELALSAIAKAKGE